MKVSELLAGVDFIASKGDVNVDVTSVTSDSRLVRKGSVFVAIPGLQKNGTEFVPQAVAKGAAAVIAGVAPQSATPAPASGPTRAHEGGATSAGVTFIQVTDPRAALATVAANFYGRPAEKLSLIGVTGTSGKTTTTKMIEAMLDATGQPVGLVGTIEYRAGEERLSADRTTPDAVVLQEWFAKMVDAGVKRAVMEVSSHALALKRTFGVHFTAAVFTNLSREHFDFHKDFEDYFNAKRILFTQIDRSRRSAVVNGDDEYGRRLLEELGDAAISFGRSSDADIHPFEGFAITVRGLSGVVRTPNGDVRVDSHLLGLPNLYNLLGAIGSAQIAGLSNETIAAGIRNLASVRGRFERVGGEGGPTVIVDYAHKPDALDKLLRAVRDIAGGKRVVVIFGCGGDRDRGKRPQMGEIATRLADYTILTSDNPRSEDPEAILDEIETGLSGVERSRYARIADRRLAIGQAIENARPDEVIVIAGKGHETYQVTGDQVVHFDDREEAELALTKKHNNKQSSKISTN